MQLSRFTDYSLRVLLYLVINRGKRCTLHEIAAFYPVSLEHLRKVVHELSRSGYIHTWRGKKGGLELGMEPGEIRVGEVVKHFEGHDSLIACGDLGCRLSAFCTLKSALSEGHRALFECLNQYTLQDLVNDNGSMGSALKAGQAGQPVLIKPLRGALGQQEEEV